MLDAILATYRPFLDPLPIWRLPVQLWTPVLLIPLTIAIAVVYKSIKCSRMSKVPRQSAALTGWILLFMLAAAIVLYVVVRGVEWIS
jgi:hypothetical protein